MVGPITTGKDFNYYSSLVISGAAFPDSPQAQISFRGPQKLRFDLTAGTTLEYSFNGNTVHGNMTVATNTATLDFHVRNNKFIWFRSSGGATVRVEAYGL
jgi:hypothetical protein